MAHITLWKFDKKIYKEPVVQILGIPFDKFSMNGVYIEIIDYFMFLLSLSKHETGFIQLALLTHELV